MHRAISATTGISLPIAETEIASNDANPHLKFIVNYRAAGKRKQKSFETEQEAVQFARSKDPNFQGPIEDTEPQATARMLLECTNQLNAHGKTIKDATDFFIQKITAGEKSCSVSKLIEEFTAAISKQPTSLFDLHDIRSHLSQFADEFGDRLVKTITSAEIGEWLESLNVSTATREYDRGLVMLAFSFAVLRGYIKANPVFELTKRSSQIF